MQDRPMRWITNLVVALSCTLTLAASTGHAGGTAFVRISPEQMQWQAVPDGYGAQTATIAGDPAGPGLYIQRVRFPPHVMDRPHWHPHDRYVTVVKGTWYTGTGLTFDLARAVPLKPGSVMLHPAQAVHWDGSNSDEEVIVQVVGLGPGDTTSVDPAKPFWVQLKR
jgi:quercetin dioxygenase-like cupin family protein